MGYLKVFLTGRLCNSVSLTWETCHSDVIQGSNSWVQRCWDSGCQQRTLPSLKNPAKLYSLPRVGFSCWDVGERKGRRAEARTPRILPLLGEFPFPSADEGGVGREGARRSWANKLGGLCALAPYAFGPRVAYSVRVVVCVAYVL